MRDPWVTRMISLPATVVSKTLEGPLDWHDAILVSGDAVDVRRPPQEESELPLRSHGSLSMNRSLMAAGLVDLVQVTLFPDHHRADRGKTRSFRVRRTSTWNWSISRTLDANIHGAHLPTDAPLSGRKPAS